MGLGVPSFPSYAEMKVGGEMRRTWLYHGDGHVIGGRPGKEGHRALVLRCLTELIFCCRSSINWGIDDERDLWKSRKITVRHSSEAKTVLDRDNDKYHTVTVLSVCKIAYSGRLWSRVWK